MKRTAYTIGGSVIGLALLLLLGYSLDRTSWLLSLYEAEQQGTLAAALGINPLALGVAAAVVIELGAIALIVADALVKLDDEIAGYVWAGLVVVLAVQGFANLLAGFLRGYHAPIAALTAQGVDAGTAERVAWLAWAVANTAIPVLIFILAKLEARVLALALGAAPQPRKDARMLLRRLLWAAPQAHTASPHAALAAPQEAADVAPQIAPAAQPVVGAPQGTVDAVLAGLKQRVYAGRKATPPLSWAELAGDVGRSVSTVRGWYDQMSGTPPQEA